jgi:hypothetical protein
MLYTGFKSYFYIDRSGRLGFEIYREKASRISIKSKSTKNRVEQEMFGVFGDDNMFRISGSSTELRRLILTCKDFVEKYEYKYKIPKGATTLIFSKPGITGPIEIKEGEVKIVDCSIYWVVGNKPYVKHIPFAWLFSNSSYLNKIDPFIHSESDFYSSLFGRLYEIITRGYEEPVDENTKLKVLQVYMKLIERIEEEFKKELATTRADEAIFQQLLKRYKFFLYPEAILIVNQPILYGKVAKKPDFYIQVGEEEHIYVEIEPPFYKPFEGSEQSSRLKGALKQIAEWKKILIQQAPLGGSIHYMIIIGRLADLNKEEIEALQDFNKAQEDLMVVTWDWILRNVDKIKHESISKLSQEKLDASKRKWFRDLLSSSPEKY